MQMTIRCEDKQVQYVLLLDGKISNNDGFLSLRENVPGIVSSLEPNSLVRTNRYAAV